MVSKVHITLSIGEELYERMKTHPEIKWSEAARRGIVATLREVEEVVNAKELLEELSEETRKFIEEAPEKVFTEAYKKIKASEWKRTKYLTRAYS